MAVNKIKVAGKIISLDGLAAIETRDLHEVFNVTEFGSGQVLLPRGGTVGKFTISLPSITNPNFMFVQCSEQFRIELPQGGAQQVVLEKMGLLGLPGTTLASFGVTMTSLITSAPFTWMVGAIG